MPRCMPGVVVARARVSGGCALAPPWQLLRSPGPGRVKSGPPPAFGCFGSRFEPLFCISPKPRRKTSTEWCRTELCSVLWLKIADGGAGHGDPNTGTALTHEAFFAIHPNHAAGIYLQESHVDPSETRVSPHAKGDIHVCCSLLPCYQTSKTFILKFAAGKYRPAVISALQYPFGFCATN